MAIGSPEPLPDKTEGKVEGVYIRFGDELPSLSESSAIYNKKHEGWEISKL